MITRRKSPGSRRASVSSLIIATMATVGWMGCGFVAAGFNYAYFQRRFPDLADQNRRKDSGEALIAVLIGPIALLGEIAGDRTRHGWLFPGSKP